MADHIFLSDVEKERFAAWCECERETDLVLYERLRDGEMVHVSFLAKIRMKRADAMGLVASALRGIQADEEKSINIVGLEPDNA